LNIAYIVMIIIILPIVSLLINLFIYLFPSVTSIEITTLNNILKFAYFNYLSKFIKNPIAFEKF